MSLFVTIYSAQFDQHLRQTLAIDPDAANFRLVTDGALPLRQCLHPEACSKGLQLPTYYTRYNDLRKEFVRFSSADLSCALVAVKDLKHLASMPALPAAPASIAEMMQRKCSGVQPFCLAELASWRAAFSPVLRTSVCLCKSRPPRAHGHSNYA